MFKYTPLYKPNQIIYGEGHPVIITGWTVKEFVTKKLDKTHYSAIGQLYSPARGISFLVRNFLANPWIKDLIIISATKEDGNAGGCQCLYDFFLKGVRRGLSQSGKDVWVVNSSVEGYIDPEIPLVDLDLLRGNVNCHFVKSVDEAIAVAKAINTLPVLWSEPKTYPITEVKPTVIPGPLYGHRIEGKTIAETWVKIIHRIKTTGVIRPTGYDGQWQELIDLMAIVTDEPDDFFFPEPNYLPCDRNFINEYLPQMLDDAPKREGVKYTYGQRMRSWFGKDQIEQVINKLINEIDAASAVINLWDVSDHEKGGSPCLNHIWLRIVDGELSLTATFRSNDMFSAWPSNAMGLRALQKHIRDEINSRSDFDLILAPLITISQSAHIYSDTWEHADRVIKEYYKPQVDYSDPAGNYLIEASARQIQVTHTTPGTGENVQCFTGKNPLRLAREICSASPFIHPAHAAYLGIELNKASYLQNGYIQDKT